MLFLLQEALQVTCKYSYKIGNAKTEIKEQCSKAPKCVKYAQYNSSYTEIKGKQCPVSQTVFGCQQISGMKCKEVKDGFEVKTTTTTTGSTLANGTVESPITYKAVALFGDRTDAIVLLCTTLIFGIIMVVLLLMQCGCLKCCGAKKGGSRMH